VRRQIADDNALGIDKALNQRISRLFKELKAAAKNQKQPYCFDAIGGRRTKFCTICRPKPLDNLRRLEQKTGYLLNPEDFISTLKGGSIEQASHFKPFYNGKSKSIGWF
jgi:hypothetical protein